MAKRYYAYVAEDVVGYFEEKLSERSDEVKIVQKTPSMSENCEPVIYYELEAEEGVIDSKWELK